MIDDIQAVLESQHRLLNALMLEALRSPDALDVEAWDAFREVLTRHIAIEEKVLLRALSAAGVDFPLATRLHDEHRAIGAMLAEPPTVELARSLRQLMDRHEALEESEIGLFSACAHLEGAAELARAVNDFRVPGEAAASAPSSWAPRTREEAFALARARKP